MIRKAIASELFTIDGYFFTTGALPITELIVYAMVAIITIVTRKSATVRAFVVIIGSVEFINGVNVKRKANTPIVTVILIATCSVLFPNIRMAPSK